MREIFPQFRSEVILHNVRRIALRRVLEGESLLPRKLRRESPGEAARVAAVLALLPQSSLLRVKRLLEEAIHVAVGGGDQIRADAVVHHEEEPVLPAGLPDEARGGGGGVAGEESAEVDDRNVELRRVRGGALVVRPHELRRNVELVLQNRRVED